MLTDHDYHPDEPTVRIFRTPSPGVLRLDDDVAISEAVYDEVVLRHYAFAGHWFKVNVTTGPGGRPTETGDPGRRFAVNCDIATPMEREGDSTFGVGPLAERLPPVAATWLLALSALALAAASSAVLGMLALTALVVSRARRSVARENSGSSVHPKTGPGSQVRPTRSTGQSVKLAGSLLLPSRTTSSRRWSRVNYRGPRRSGRRPGSSWLPQAWTGQSLE